MNLQDGLGWLYALDDAVMEVVNSGDGDAEEFFMTWWVELRKGLWKEEESKKQPASITTEDDINHLYAEIRTLRAEPSSVENETRYQCLLGRLRTLQHEEVPRIERLLAARSEIQIGAVEEALRRADDLIARYENDSRTDPSARKTDS